MHASTDRSNTFHRTTKVLKLILLAAAMLWSAQRAAADAYPQKPAQAVVQPGHLSDKIAVKFRDGQTIRARNSKLSDLGSGALNPAQAVLNQLGGGRWDRTHTLSEERLATMSKDAARNAGKSMPDLNLQFTLTLPPGMDAATAINLLNALEVVEMAQAIPAEVKTAAPDYVPNQVYRRTTPVGLGTERVRNLNGGDGAAVRICDIEYSWNLAHLDLPSVTVLDTGYDPFNDKNHGTAVLGVLAAKDDGSGITGIVPDAQIYVSPAMTAPNQGASHIPAAITLAANALRKGDVILLEQQIAGPNYNPPACCFTNPGGCPPGTDCQFGLVPVEWYKPIYDAIMVAAMSQGIIIIEAAGNGSQDLNDPIFTWGNNGHWPFMANNPWIIMVGAGAAAQESNGSALDRSRLSFSNHGVAVDVQGWGEGVWATGYGMALGAPGYTAAGVNNYFTGRFSGTSSASAMIAGAVGQLQSIYKTIAAPISGLAVPEPLNVQQIEELLKETGQPQQYTGNPLPPPGSFNIGPRPDIAMALRRMGSLAVNERRWCGEYGQTAPPQLMEWTRMAYDSGRQRMVVPGGRYTNYQYSNDTWEYDGNSWYMTGSPPIPFTVDNAIAYDSGRGMTILYGGSDPNTSQVTSTMMEYNGFGWVQRFTPHSPGPLYGAAMAYDSARGVTVLFGGGIGNSPNMSGQTWEFNGFDWTLRANSGPIPRAYHGMAYDSARGVTVLHGGFNYQGGNSLNTWEWNGSSWTNRNITPGPGWQLSNMAYDSSRQVIVTTRTAETWEYDGRSWAQVDRPCTLDPTPSGTNPPGPSALAYDSTRNQMMILACFNQSYAQFLKFVPALSFTQLPVSKTVQVGDSVTFTAQVSNSAGAWYNWMHNNLPVMDGPNISGAHSSTLTIQSATQADAGNYEVFVNSTDPCDFVTTHWMPQPMIPQLAQAVLTVQTCVADVNGNGVVNVDDLLAIINAWGPCPQPCPPHCAADITKNCFVNVDDLLALINAWGMCP